MWIIKDFMRQIGNVHHFNSTRTTLIISSAQESCIVIKRWRWRWILCAKDDPKFSWQRCLSLVLISCLTKWPFSLHSDIMESHFTQVISFSVQSELRADWRQQNYSPVFFFFFFLRAHGWVRVFAILLLVSPFFSFPLHRLNSKSYLCGFSYAMVTGMITSWQETSRQIEASYLWQLLSNCCSRGLWPLSATHLCENH